MGERARTLTEADVEALADAIAAKLRRAAPPESPAKPKRTPKPEIHAAVAKRLRRAGVTR